MKNRLKNGRFTNGHMSYMTDKCKKKISRAMKGKIRTLSHRQNLSIAHKGKKLSPKHLKNLTIAQRKRMDNRGENCHFWKGGISKDKKYISWLKNKRNRMPKIGSHTWGEWQTLKAQYDWTCPNCKKSEPEINLTQDHIIPLSKGGSDNIENIQPLCRKCNFSKHTMTIKYEQ